MAGRGSLALSPSGILAVLAVVALLLFLAVQKSLQNNGSREDFHSAEHMPWWHPWWLPAPKRRRRRAEESLSMRDVVEDPTFMWGVDASGRVPTGGGSMMMMQQQQLLPVPQPAVQAPLVQAQVAPVAEKVPENVPDPVPEPVPQPEPEPEPEPVKTDLPPATPTDPVPTVPSKKEVSIKFREGIVPVKNGLQGDCKTTRYWDCCMPSCSWPGKGKGKVTAPVATCDSAGKIITGAALSRVRSGCPKFSNGDYKIGDPPNATPFVESSDPATKVGQGFACPNQVPTVVDDQLAYGFAAGKFKGHATPDDECCKCVLLEFVADENPANASVVGKQMVVQLTNIGYDLEPEDGDAHFDIMIPGGGEGLFMGCSANQFYTPNNGYTPKLTEENLLAQKGTSTWGKRYGGVSSEAECEFLPEPLRAGCKFRFGWGGGMDNPKAKFKQVQCPLILTETTGCARTDDVADPSHIPATPATTAAASSQPANTSPTTTPTPATTPATTPTTTPAAVVQPAACDRLSCKSVLAVYSKGNEEFSAVSDIGTKWDSRMKTIQGCTECLYDADFQKHWEAARGDVMGTAPIPTDCDVTACKAALEDFANATNTSGNKKNQFFDPRVTWDDVRKQLTGCAKCPYTPDFDAHFKTNLRCFPVNCENALKVSEFINKPENWDIGMNWSAVQDEIESCEFCDFKPRFKDAFNNARASQSTVQVVMNS